MRYGTSLWLKYYMRDDRKQNVPFFEFSYFYFNEFIISLQKQEISEMSYLIFFTISHELLNIHFILTF